jgi:ATP-binding cassette subfamily G (WHITE) protein 2 (SNQ2)
LHIFTALFNGLSWVMIGNDYIDLQNRLFSCFNFIFIAPAGESSLSACLWLIIRPVISQLFPKFMANRDIFEGREKKAMIYSWKAFIFSALLASPEVNAQDFSGEIVSEIPYLLICTLLFFVCWW